MITTVEEYLQDFLKQNGEQAWQTEVQRLAVAALRTGSSKHETFWRELTSGYDWLDWEQIKEQAQPIAPDPDRLIAEAFKSQMPGVKSQAQYDAAVGVLESARLIINALLSQDLRREKEARNVLERSLDAVRQATELTVKLEDSPEAATSETAQQFKDTPMQFEETEIHAQLKQELLLVGSFATLSEWYGATKDRRDRIVTQSMRNDLIDAIRAKRTVLAG